MPNGDKSWKSYTVPIGAMSLVIGIVAAAVRWQTTFEGRLTLFERDIRLKIAPLDDAWRRHQMELWIERTQRLNPTWTPAPIDDIKAPTLPD